MDHSKNVLLAVHQSARCMTDQFISAYLKALRRIESNTQLSTHEQVKEVFNLFTLLIEEVTSEENISFTTLFSRLAYVGSRESLPGQLLYRCHAFRRYCEQALITDENATDVAHLGFYTISELCNRLLGTTLDSQAYLPATQNLVQERQRKVVHFQPLIEAIVLSIDPAARTLTFVDEAEGDTEKLARYDVPDRNEIFTANIQSVDRYFDLPIAINLIDVELTEDGYYIPAAFVIQPDYLVDVTAIAECFSSDGAQPLFYLLRKFMPRTLSSPIMIGNIVNHLLDELVSDPQITFNMVLEKIFKVAPLQFALYDDGQVKEILGKCYTHFLHMKRVVNSDFKQQKIYIGNVYLEPAFYSRRYGLQGRLDLLHLDGKKNLLDIVELKSGKPYRTNVYGLNQNHYTQTLLYDLIIQSTFGSRFDMKSYILYSSAETDSLRFAPVVKAQQWEAAKVRNHLIGIHHQMAQLDEPSDKNILQFLAPIHFPDTKGYVAKDLEQFDKVYKQLDSLEKAYFDHMVAFVAREHQLAKTGEHGLNKSNGLAALWLENIEEKEDRFAILKELEITQNDSKADPPTLTLARTSATNPLANFRPGDIAVLYPASDGPQNVLHNQIFKCSIVAVDAAQVTVRLRSKQYNHAIFKQNDRWHIEEDILDSSFNAMYRSLFEWAAAPPAARRLLLGRQAPRLSQDQSAIHLSGQLTDEQQGLLQEIIHAEDYYLLWGPPGTGKTSMMLKHYVNYLFHQTETNILLLAYTNRAVDEICAAIESLDPNMVDHYLRIGSRNGCGPAYRGQLLGEQIRGLTRREQIVDLIGQRRIVVSTVSSLLGNAELLALKHFDTVVIDEASQILEPMLVGLLTRFPKFVLIGDHKQLPAVVRQRKEQSEHQHEELAAVGIYDGAMSLFERLYLQAQRDDMGHSIGILGAQGRMHEEIMDFPNRFFYGGQLRIIESVGRLTGPVPASADGPMAALFQQHRKLYIPTQIDSTYNWKINLHEARAVVRVVKHLQEWFTASGRPWRADSVGIITPYRAQIAQVKDLLIKADFELPITVDTVERYQGGARDIIILSLCTNRLAQMDSLVSLSMEGIDRKLNVALTRAREHLIVLGNRDILASNETYAALIQQCEPWRVDG